MFDSLSHFVTRFWIGLLVAWGALFVVATTTAPRWSEVSVDGELRHLPQDMPTRRGEELLETAFPGDVADSNIVLVVHRAEEPLLPKDRHFVLETLTEGLREIAEQHGGLVRDQPVLAWIPHEIREAVEGVSSHGVDVPESLEPLTEPPVSTEGLSDAGPRIVSITSLADGMTATLLNSSDGHATLVVVDLTSGFLVSKNTELVADVQSLVDQLRKENVVPEGLEIALSGSAVIGAGTIEAVSDSTIAVRRWAIWIAVALLLIVFRAPIAALVPLASMYVSVEVTLWLLAWAAHYEVVSVFDGLPLYLTVIVYGAGVDYSLFLLARHQEEMQKGHSAVGAVSRSIRSVGTAIAASAGTEIVGIGLLVIAEFGKFRQAGFGVALGLVVLLIASLTLTTSILCLFRRWTYWPQPLTEEHKVKRFSLDWISARIWRDIGIKQRKYPGIILTATVALLAPLAIVGAANLDNLSYGVIAGLPDDSLGIRGTEKLREYFDAGITGPITLLLYNDEEDFSSHAGIRQIADLTEGLRRRGDELHIADIRSLSAPLGDSEKAKDVIDQLAETVPFEASFLKRGELVVTDASGMAASDAFLQGVVRELAYEHYVSHATAYEGTVTRLTIVPEGAPFRLESIQRLDQLEKTIRELLPEELAGTEVYLLGATASLRDIRDVGRRDWQRIRIVIPVAVFLVLLMMLQRPIVSAYLVLTVVFSFLITFGVTHSVFWALDPDGFQGLEWTVPILLFTLLIAVGEDYSVLLVSRTEEERQEHSPTRGVTEALVKTGGLISGAGLIMAGTFSALLIGGAMASTRQLGFALCFGVLLDTFLVRPVLVPSFLDLVARWQVWRRLRKQRSSGESDSGVDRTDEERDS